MKSLLQLFLSASNSLDVYPIKTELLYSLSPSSIKYSIACRLYSNVYLHFPPSRLSQFPPFFSSRIPSSLRIFSYSTGLIGSLLKNLQVIAPTSSLSSRLNTILKNFWSLARMYLGMEVTSIDSTVISSYRFRSLLYPCVVRFFLTISGFDMHAVV